MRAMLIVLAALLFTVPACASVGRDFDAARVQEIQDGKTTKAEIDALFGTPFVQDTLEPNDHGWASYYSYNYSRATAGGLSSSGKALVIYFDENDVVASHGYSED